MNITKAVMFTFSIAIGLFYSCEIAVNNFDTDKETERKIRTMLMTPDSLRSAEDKALFQQMESVVYEGCTVENGRIEMTISKEELHAMGIPKVCYDMIKKDVDDLNDGLDKPHFPRQVVLDAFRQSQEEYRAQKESHHAE